MRASDVAGQSPAFAPIRAGSLVTEVREQIREAILSGKVHAGDQVRDSVVAGQMNISRAPVREALRLLEQSGLVEKTANKPYTVKSFDGEDLHELVVLRIAIETTAARVVIAQHRDLGPVREALAEMRRAWDHERGSGMDAADWAFHNAIVVASGQQRLLARYRELVDQIILAWVLHGPERPRVTAGDVGAHAELLDALDRGVGTGDHVPVQELLVSHIKSGMGCDDLDF
ncbi:GntR family transcriptional regulator [Georgenia sp. SYP-B2076]|uniref:GntR family transcriptional regulator n=1 Tax=Georgenia sp. SYP-B2076 TaxID=2495881 RepID=UPI000F8D4AC5|nr:GntR family transcriptional regulator [Georgenia sp. SYP-B2076]